MAGGTFGSYVLIDPVKLADLMRSPSGPVVRLLLEDGELVKTEAQRLVGVHKPDPGDPMAGRRARRPGTLRDSIVKRLAEYGGGVAVLVGSDDPIALWHHEGTVPHIITPRVRPALVFYSAKVGRVVRTLMVHHRGTKPNRFLVDALRVLAGH